jgi:hypothetical protein
VPNEKVAEGAAPVPNEKLGWLFLAGGSDSSSADLFADVGVDPVGGPKLKLFGAGAGADPAPKNDGFVAGASCFCCPSKLLPNVTPPKMPLLLGAAVLDSTGFPKLKLGFASAPDGAEVDGAEGDGSKKLLAVPLGTASLSVEVPPAAAFASNFPIVLPKKLGTGPSFFASGNDFDGGSDGLLKKSEAGESVIFFGWASIFST